MKIARISGKKARASLDGPFPRPEIQAPAESITTGTETYFCHPPAPGSGVLCNSRCVATPSRAKPHAMGAPAIVHARINCDSTVSRDGSVNSSRISRAECASGSAARRFSTVHGSELRRGSKILGEMGPFFRRGSRGRKCLVKRARAIFSRAMDRDQVRSGGATGAMVCRRRELCAIDYAASVADSEGRFARYPLRCARRVTPLATHDAPSTAYVFDSQRGGCYLRRPLTGRGAAVRGRRSRR